MRPESGPRKEEEEEQGRLVKALPQAAPPHENARHLRVKCGEHAAREKGGVQFR